MTDPDPKSRLVTVCSACLCASCWHGTFMCDESRTAGTTTRAVAELDALGREHRSHYSIERVREVQRLRPVEAPPEPRRFVVPGGIADLPATRAHETARLLLQQSITERVEEMRLAAERARCAYQKPGPLRDAALRLAGAYVRAAAVLEAELSGVQR